MANKPYSNENATPQREICLLETTEVKPYLGQGDTSIPTLANTGHFFCFSHLALLNRPAIFELLF